MIIIIVRRAALLLIGLILMSYDYLITLLYEYFYRQQMERENDLTQLINNISLRRADELDHLEMIMALVRLRCTDAIAQDVYKLVAISRI